MRQECDVGAGLFGYLISTMLFCKVLTHYGLSSLFPNDGAALECTVHAGSEG